MKNKNMISSFKYALEGLFYCLKNERNMKIHYVIMIIVIIMGLIYKISILEWYICILLFGLVISLEYMNTAIENTVDICSPEKNKIAKIAKDSAAASVLISAIVSVVIGLIIFLPKIFNL